MDSIDLTIYLVDDIVSGPVCMFQPSNTIITLGVSTCWKSKCWQSCSIVYFFHLAGKNCLVFHISSWIVSLCLVVAVGWTDQLKRYFLCEKNEPLCCVFVVIFFVTNLFDFYFEKILSIRFITPKNISVCVLKERCVFVTLYCAFLHNRYMSSQLLPLTLSVRAIYTICVTIAVVLEKSANFAYNSWEFLTILNWMISIV